MADNMEGKEYTSLTSRKFGESGHHWAHIVIKMAKNMQKWNENINNQQRTEKMIGHKRPVNKTVQKQRNRRRGLARYHRF